MSEQKKSISRLRRNLLVALFSVVIILIAVGSYLASIYGSFQRDYNKLTMAMRDGDVAAVEMQIDALVQYNQLAQKWYLGSVAEKYLFQNMSMFRAAETLLKGDYRALKEDKLLDQSSDQHLVAHILGLARAGFYRGLYQQKLRAIKAKKGKLDKKDQVDLDAIVKQVISESRPYFKLAVENSPGNDLYFEYPFNHDLFQNEESARKVMENPGEQPPPMGYGPSQPDGKKPSGDAADESRKINPGDQSEPGGQSKPGKPKG